MKNYYSLILLFCVSLGIGIAPSNAKPNAKHRKKTIVKIEKCRGIGIFVACPQFVWPTRVPTGNDVYFTRDEFQALLTASKKQKSM